MLAFFYLLVFCIKIKHYLKLYVGQKMNVSQGFLGGSVVTNQTEFDSWSRKIPRAGEQLSLCATSIEPVL